MINPDQNDIRLSANMAERLKISIIRAERQGVDVLDGLQEKFDSIWAISVIEHISGKHDDRLAVRLMYDALAAGGHLILTIPVDRQFWEEHRDLTYYGIGGMMPDKGKYFFQRYYDKSAIWKRLVESIDVEPFAVGWFGEKRMGHFLDYEKRWLRDGLSCTFNDPLEMSEHYQEYPSWDVMPGKGICGLAFKKPG
jgi:SAM-dependent methyltransferase